MATDDPAARWPHYREDDFIIRNFAFKSGEVLPELRLHYRTMGVPRRDAAGTIVNGVLLLQGNTGTGANWLRPSLADALYGPRQPLDAHRYVLIMPDAIGRGGSSKPSDGLRGHFPHYRYRDMVDSGYRCITEDFLPFVNPNLSHFLPHLFYQSPTNSAWIIARTMT
jgi:homoserine O-acetyltransferase/O-succinyltransferase